MVSPGIIASSLVIAAVVVVMVWLERWLAARSRRRWRIGRGNVVHLNPSARGRLSRADRADEPPICPREPTRAGGEKAGGAAPVSLDSRRRRR